MAVALRIPGLNSCMWLDEVLTMVRFARPPVGVILTSFPDQNQHMLYSLLAHACIRIFGEQAWALRLPSVAFGRGQHLGAVFLGPAADWRNRGVAGVRADDVSYHHIWFSQNARGYMGLLFFTLVATWLWLEAMDRDTWGAWMGYTVSIALGMWIHMTIVFVAGTHALIFSGGLAAVRREPARLGAAARVSSCGTLTLQLLALSLPRVPADGAFGGVAALGVDQSSMGDPGEPAQPANRVRGNGGGALWGPDGGGGMGGHSAAATARGLGHGSAGDRGRRHDAGAGA